MKKNIDFFICLFLRICACKIFAPIKTICDDLQKFFVWFLTSVIFSLSSFWIPSLIGLIIGQNLYCILFENNPFIPFSIVFLSNSIFNSINYTGAGSNKFAVELRVITLIFTIMYLIFLSSIIPLKLVCNITISQKTQCILLLITIIIGVYVYGFRESTWEKSVDQVRENGDKNVTSIVEKANNLKTDNDEVRL